MTEHVQALAVPAFFQIPNSGYLRIEGVDHLPFLQRQTTNDLNLLEPGRALITVLTNPAARILDVFTVFRGGASLEILTLPGHANMTFQYLRSRIFFRDQVEIFDLSSEFAQMDLIGPHIGEILNLPHLSACPSEERLMSIELFGVPLRLLGLRNWGWRLIFPAGKASELINMLEAMGGKNLSEELYEIIRIESGRPAEGHELISDYTPLEIGLRYAVADKKGCYTGQEVIARQITYDKITRRLVGIYLDEKAFPGDNVKTADTNQPLGKVTSVAESPRAGWIGLAVLKRPFDQAGTKVVIESQSLSFSGRVTNLPFAEHP